LIKHNELQLRHATNLPNMWHGTAVTCWKLPQLLWLLLLQLLEQAHIIMVIVMAATTFMVLSSWHCHCKSSSCSYESLQPINFSRRSA